MEAIEKMEKTNMYNDKYTKKEKDKDRERQE